MEVVAAAATVTASASSNGEGSASRPTKRPRTQEHVDSGEAKNSATSGSEVVIKQGAEARISIVNFLGRTAVRKHRFAKKYRHPTIDQRLRRTRMVHEAKCLVRCAREGIEVPQVYFVDEDSMSLYLEQIDGWTVKEFLDLHADDDSMWEAVAKCIGSAVASMHCVDIVHGDLTTSNMIVRRVGAAAPTPTALRIAIIDFGLGSQASQNPEDKAVDLYVLERAMLSTHRDSDTRLNPHMLAAYRERNDRGHFQVMDKLAAVRARGRKRMAFG